MLRSSANAGADAGADAGGKRAAQCPSFKHCTINQHKRPGHRQQSDRLHHILMLTRGVLTSYILKRSSNICDTDIGTGMFWAPVTEVLRLDQDPQFLKLSTGSTLALYAYHNRSIAHFDAHDHTSGA